MFKLSSSLKYAFSICMSVLIFMPVKAYADLTIVPTRVVFEDRDRFAEVTLVNTSDRTNVYSMDWRFFRMQEEGSAYQKVGASLTEFDLSKYVVFTPRRVTLAPGGRQRVRLALRRPGEVPAGEYRAHLQFSAVKQEIKRERVVETPTASVDINVGYSIPVVFRAGAPNESASIQNVTLTRNPQNGLLYADVSIGRGGDYGVLGHLYLYNDKGETVGEISNAHIFPEVSRRVFRVPIVKEDEIGKSLRIVLRSYEPDSPRVYAEEVLPIQ